jgi:hypothetical protein
MARPFALAILAGSACAVAGGAMGCGSSNGQPTDDGGSQDADFVQCAMSPAVDYMPGISVTSASGNYVATLVSAKTDFADGTSANTAATGTDAFVVSIANAADAGGGPATDVMLTAERPWMPFHNHGATTYPTVTPGDPGTFNIGGIVFFQTGYWSEVLDLTPAAGGTDKATFALCIRQ